MMRRPIEIEIEIDQIVVTGLGIGAEGALRDAIVFELTRVLSLDAPAAHADIEAIAAALVEKLAP